MKEAQTKETLTESIERNFQNAAQTQDKTSILKLLELILLLIKTMIDADITKDREKTQPRKDYMKNVPPPPEIVNKDAPFLEPRDPEKQRQEIAKGRDKTQEAEKTQEVTPQKQQKKQKDKGMSL